jgi:histidinol phosphatase-like PHP family hydrolase
MPTNRAEIMDDYAATGIALSISGHYHAGAGPLTDRGVTYLTVPALTEPPFRYAVVTVGDSAHPPLSRRAGTLPTGTLRGTRVPMHIGMPHVEIRQLQMPADVPIIDDHAHSQFAYCGRALSAEAVIARSRLMGLRGVCIVEHAPQLYCTAEEFWGARHIRQPKLWREGTASRMAEFRRHIEPLRSDFVRIGLEVEIDSEGCLTLKDEDRDWPDVLVGAVHWLSVEDVGLSDAQAAEAFLSDCRRLIEQGIDVLAHPFRYFRWCKPPRPVPLELFAILAEMLAKAGVAAEINFHKNINDVPFFTECVRRGVKIATGSDTHEVFEAGAFWPHLDILRAAAGGRNLTELLMRLPGETLRIRRRRDPRSRRQP